MWNAGKAEADHETRRSADLGRRLYVSQHLVWRTENTTYAFDQLSDGLT